jgi:hypothetical protein
MCHWSEAEFDAKPFAKLMKLIRGKVASIVRYDAVWYAEATSDAMEEFGSCCSYLVGYWYSLYPFGEVVNCDQ